MIVTEHNILKICSVRMGMVLKFFFLCILQFFFLCIVPLHFYRMVAKGIISVLCHFALLAFVNKSVHAVSMLPLLTLFYFFLCITYFGSAYSFTKSGERWPDGSVGSQNFTYQYWPFFVKLRAAKGKSLTKVHAQRRTFLKKMPLNSIKS